MDRWIGVGLVMVFRVSDNIRVRVRGSYCYRKGYNSRTLEGRTTPV